MIKFKKYNRCWICGNLANSGEHIYKRSDLTREFDSVFKSNQSVSRVTPQQEILIKGAKSKKIRFENCLCEKCNNEKTQPFDFAYDTFNNFFKKNESTIFNSRLINLDQIFGNSWESEFNNLKKYYAKHVGCVLVSQNIEILPDIINFILNDDKLTSLSFNFVLRSDIFDLCRIIREKENEEIGYLGRSSLSVEYSNSKESCYSVDGSYIYRSLEMCYHYSNEDTIGSNFVFAPIIPMLVWESPTYQAEIKKIEV